MQDFKVTAEIKHLNIRKEGEEREVLAIDVKMSATVSADLVDSLMCEDINDGDALRAFWLENETLDVRFRNLSEMAFSREYKGVKAELIGMELTGCKLGKFRFLPMPKGQALLTFSLTAKEPPAYAVDRLAEMMASDVDVAFTMPQGELFAEGEGDVKDAAAKLDDSVSAMGATATLEVAGKVLATFGDGDGSASDPLYEQAVAFVVESGKASPASLQRHLRIGYNRSARMIEAMEAAGVVGHMQPNGHRDVIQKNQ